MLLSFGFRHFFSHLFSRTPCLGSRIVSRMSRCRTFQGKPQDVRSHSFPYLRPYVPSLGAGRLTDLSRARLKANSSLRLETVHKVANPGRIALLQNEVCLESRSIVTSEPNSVTPMWCVCVTKLGKNAVSQMRLTLGN